MNNLPRVVAQIMPRSESNPRPLDHESNALPLHHRLHSAGGTLNCVGALQQCIHDLFRTALFYYLRDAMLARVFATATCLSVSPVRHTPVLCQNEES